MQILHISGDYPDPIRPWKTRAVANLLELLPEHEHRVVSITRQGAIFSPSAWNGSIDVRAFEDAAGRHWALTYNAPAKGILHRSYLERLADAIDALASEAGFVPDLIHAHKLTIEGIVARRLARSMRRPFLLSIQGNTDLKIARARPDMRRLYGTIWREAAVALPFAPWTSAALQGFVGPRDGRTTPLPCPDPADDLIAPRVTPAGAAPTVVSAFNLADKLNKNGARLIRAAARASEAIPNIRLEILGAGDPGSLRGLGERLMPGRVSFVGPVPHSEIQRRFNGAAAFALVSHRESFGMVFTESLLAGTPCLYPRGRAIDGYLPEGSVVLAADPTDEAGIASALVRLLREEADFKSRLGALQNSGGLDFLRRRAIAEVYRSAISDAAACPM